MNPRDRLPPSSTSTIQLVLFHNNFLPKENGRPIIQVGNFVARNEKYPLEKNRVAFPAQRDNWHEQMRNYTGSKP